MTTQKNILLIEDDIELAELATAFFRQKDIHVTHFVEPLDALQAVLSHKTKPDAIITDLNLPMMTGVDFIKRLRS